jgi:hypothetical protein
MRVEQQTQANGTGGGLFTAIARLWPNAQSRQQYMILSVRFGVKVVAQ